MRSSPLKKSTVEEIRDRFDNDVERFSNLETGQKAVNDAALMMELITSAAVAVTPDAVNILDIGCGAGNNTIKLLQKLNPLNCTLLDLSGAMLKRANERVISVNKGTTKTIQGDFRSAELPSGYYDVVIAAAVLHHLRDDNDWEEAFKKYTILPPPAAAFGLPILFTTKTKKFRNLCGTDTANIF